MENKLLLPKDLYKQGKITKEHFADEQRKLRDWLLEKTDKYLMPDYPITAESLMNIKNYRQTLRDLPQQKKFPDIEIPEIPIL